MKKLTFKLKDFQLKNKRVFLRADLNVPIKNGNILDDFRLEQILPTIDLIQKNEGKVILATHIDRPKKYDPNLSTKNLIIWFEKNGYKIDFEGNINDAIKKSFTDFDKILLLENLRFFEGEQKQSNEFAQSLAKLSDFYVNDAFGLLHRNDTSITLLPKLFNKENRTIGLLVEKELEILGKITKKTDHPFLIILGGGKVPDKIELLANLINKVDGILLCPAIVFTFLKNQNKNVGKSLIDNESLNIVNTIEQKIKSNNSKLLLPLDYIVAKDSLAGPLSTIDVENFSNDDIGISIGPKTAQLFNEDIEKARLIFFNGLPGFLDRKETLENIKSIFDAMSKSKAYTIIAGGDSVAAARLLGYQNNFNHLSTGGGAVLAYLSGKELPGLKFLN